MQYLLFKEYIFQLTNSRWKIPLNFFEKFHLFIIKIFLKISWFSDSLYIKNQENISHDLLFVLRYLVKNKIIKGYFSKEIVVEDELYYKFSIQAFKKVSGTEIVLTSWGISKNKDEAVSKALGEILERYVTCIPTDTPKRIQNTSKNIYLPNVYHDFLDIQKQEFSKNQKSDPKYFLEGENILTNEKILIPEQLLYWKKYSEQISSEKLLQDKNTNGNAGFFDYKGAILAGIYEVIERDSFMVHYLTKTAPSEILKPSLPKQLLYFTENIEKSFDLKMNIFETTSDIGIPSICVTARKENKLAISLCSNLNIELAIQKALQDILVVQENFIKNEKWEKEITPFLSRIEMSDRILVWNREDFKGKMNWFYDGDKINFKNNIENIDNEYIQVLNILKTKGEKYYPLVYKYQDNIQNIFGFKVVKVFIPFCFPLYLTEIYGTFKSQRLEEYYKYKTGKNFNSTNLNPTPHPFL